MNKEFVILLVIFIFSVNIQNFYNLYKLSRSESAIIKSTPYQKYHVIQDKVPYMDTELTLLAEFRLDAMVISKKRYVSDLTAKYAPFDLLLGWGPMSDPDILKHIHIKQGGRRGTIRYKSSSPVPHFYVQNFFSNVHAIPADRAILEIISVLQPGNVIHLEGYLVHQQGKNWSWKSSLSRSDSGYRSCEIFYIKKIDAVE